MAKKSRNPPKSSVPRENPASAVLEAEPPIEESPPEENQRRDDRYWVLATAVLLVAIVVRQWRLANACYHPDEAIHAYFSMGFASYHYDPTYHGPLLYHLVSTTFGVFGTLARLFGAKAPDGDLITLGSTEYSARLVPSLCGIALVWLILGPMKRHLGQRGALISGALVALSPAIVTYSRRLLHDSLVLLLTMGAVACFLTALEEPSNTPRGRNARLGVIAFLTLFLATKANVFFIIVMLGVFWLLWKISGLISLPEEGLKLLPPVLWFLVTATAILWPRSNSSLPDIQAHQHMLFQIAAAGSCLWMALWVLTRKPSAEERETRKFSLSRFDPLTYVLCAGAALWIYAFLFGNGAQILATLARDHHTDPEQLRMGRDSARYAIHKMLEYWGGQQKHPRLPGRHDYYIVLMLLYEVPILLAGLGGIWHAAKNRSVFTDLLMWWAFTSWTLYAVANEKVPWLSVHILLPLALLGGIWLGQVVRWRQPAWAVAGVLAGIFSVRSIWGADFQNAGDHAEPLFYAQTPEAYHNALNNALAQTEAKDQIWMNNERQWPTVWYLRKWAPGMGASTYTFGKSPTTDKYRMVLAMEPEWNSYFKPKGWQSAGIGEEVTNFLIWPRASWDALRPDRYAKWWWTRDTVPASERKLSQPDWKESILSGRGEWSNATVVIGVPGPK